MSILKQNENFCSAPWITLHIEPNGGVSPCCIATCGPDPDNAVYGNLHKESLDSILRGSKLKAFRKRFMNNERPEECSTCWRQEELHGKYSSLRSDFNRTKFNENVYSDTLEDGTYDNMKITYWDFRPSNNCNLACLMCWEGLSSGYFQLAKDLGLNVRTDKKFLEVPNDRFEEIFEIIKDTLRTHSAEMHFYFAGGEPLQMPQHHKILQYLLDNEYFDVSLRYNTNLTTLKYKKTNWADIWKKFDNVVIDASIDAVGAAGEFQRMNSSWANVKSNIQRLIDNDITVTFNMVQTMITYPYIIDTLIEISAMFTEDYLQRHMNNHEKNIRLVGTHHPDHLTLLNTPEEFIDYSILDQIDELGYDSTPLRGLLSEYDEFNADRSAVDKRWQQLKNLDSKLRIKKETGFNDLLPWFDNHVKGIITNG